MLKTALVAGIVSAVVAAASGTAATIVVTSKNIKNGTIQTVDISAKAKRALKGNRGPAGPKGAQGNPGAQGIPGAQGPRGPSTGFAGSRDVIVGDVPNSEANIGHITLPAGSYVVWAKAAFVNPGSEALVRCKLTAAGQPHIEYDRGNLKLFGPAPNYDAGVITLVAHTVGAPLSGFDFRCDDGGGTVTFFDQGIRAIQVEAVQFSP